MKTGFKTIILTCLITSTIIFLIFYLRLGKIEQAAMEKAQASVQKQIRKEKEQLLEEYKEILNSSIETELWKYLDAKNYGYYDIRYKPTVDCGLFKDGKATVMLVFGQSNSANFGLSRAASNKGVFNFNWEDGKCYEAKDPLLGANGNRGSVWTRLGDKLIKSKVFDRVLFVPLGIGATSIKDWTVGGVHFPKILTAMDALRKENIKITHVLWHQGESDYEMQTASYMEHFMAIFKALSDHGLEAPFFVSEASYCFGKLGDAVKAAQRKLPDLSERIHPGPNTDQLIGPKYRFDDCHFTHYGLEVFAHLWFEAIDQVKTIQ